MFIVEAVQLSSFSVLWSYNRATVIPSIVQAVNTLARSCFENKILSRRIFKCSGGYTIAWNLQSFDIEKAEEKPGLKEKTKLAK